MKKVVLGTREIIEYHGNCPNCQKEQKSFSDTSLDILCWDCSKKRKEAKVREQYKHLIGGTVIDIYGYNNLIMVRVKAIDGKEYDITSHSEFGESDEHLNVDKTVFEE